MHSHCHIDQELFNLSGWTIPLLLLGSTISGLFVFVLIQRTNKWYSEERFNERPRQYFETHRTKLLDVLSIINGIIEIFMFSLAILIKIPLFMAFWIGVKTALKFDFPKVTTKDSKFVYLRFLIGSALCIIFSYVIAVIINKEIIIFNLE